MVTKLEELTQVVRKATQNKNAVAERCDIANREYREATKRLEKAWDELHDEINKTIHDKT